MAGLALPLVTGMVERRRFEGAVDEVVGMLRLARSHARLEAITVDVVAVERDGGAVELIARRVDLRSFTLDDAGDPPSPLPPSWAQRRLPAELLLTDDEDAAMQAEGLDEEAEDPMTEPFGPVVFDTSGSSRERRPRRLAIFAADGSAPVAGRLILGDPSGRRAVVVINPWTGYASIDAAGPAPMAEEAASGQALEERGDA